MANPGPKGATMEQRENIAARAGRWSARHRKQAIFGWLAFVVASLTIGGAFGVNTLSNEDSGVGESGRAEKVLHESFPQRTEESVLVQSESERASDPAFRAAVADTVGRLERAEHVRDVANPYDDPSRISADGRSALVEFEIGGDDRPARPGQPDRSRRRVGQLGDPADRARRRGRLLAVLPAPRA
jgi:hypothetical protein